ncbi:amidohydrolase family protein [Nonomuraea sp. NPDC003707]
MTKIIAIEEHFSHPALQHPEALAKLREHPQLTRIQEKLEDVGTGRLADMDAAGIDVQVLSHTVPGAEAQERAQALPATQAANDALADVVAAYPDRFAGFAALPMRNPEAAAAELERAVDMLGFRGALINGTVGDCFLDQAEFAPVLERAEGLQVPIYLHPSFPPEPVAKIYYRGLDPVMANLLATAGWGWHAETALHVLRLIVSGTLDRFPHLQLIIGHMGEMIPFALDRINTVLSPMARHLRQPVADYFQTNIFFTTSGYITSPPLLCALSVVGAERLIFSVDYPYTANQPARAFLETAPISPSDREKIGHLNAERLLGL